jgi:hypothetical protein
MPLEWDQDGDVIMKRIKMKRWFRLIMPVILCVMVVLLLISCDKVSEDGGGENNGDGNGEDESTYDIEANGIPRFVYTNYIELAKIRIISKFRSGIGHDYSDDFESCRSMKHYFQPKTNVDWQKVKIFSPIDGTITRVTEDEAGSQIQIKSKEKPAFLFTIFHVNPANPLSVGDEVIEGQTLGTHTGSQTMSDIAVGVNTPDGWKLISFFDVMRSLLFQDYKDRGMNSRDAAVISRENRDADPLTCNGESFVNGGSLENWVILTGSTAY